MAGEQNPKKDNFEMIGDFCREVAVLVLVFATLDKLITPGGIGLHGLLDVLGVSFAFMVVVMAFEHWRKV